MLLAPDDPDFPGALATAPDAVEPGFDVDKWVASVGNGFVLFVVSWEEFGEEKSVLSAVCY
jgi:hypothetical protein